MKVDVEAVSSFERKINVEIPAEAVDKALNAEFKTIGKTARVRGFRPGKVPKGLLRKMYRQQAVAGVSDNLVREYLSQAFTESGVEPLAMPDVERGTVAEGEAFTFALLCQVRPEITLEGVDALTVEKQDTEPSEEDINAELERRRESQSELEPVEGRGADTGDTVTIDYSGRLADAEEPFEGGVGEGHDVEIGSGSLVPGFEDQLIGSKEEDKVEVKLTLPDNYPEELAGKDAVFDVTVRAVRTKVVPDLDDELAVDLGFDDLSALRADVYDKLRSAAVEEEDNRVREAVVAGLIAANPIEVPPALIEDAAERLKQRLGMHLRMQGLPDEFLQMALGQQAGMIDERAKELALRDLLLEALAEERGIEVTDENIDERVASIADQTGDPAPKVRAMLQRGGGLDIMRQEMLRDQALDWLIDKATGVLEALGEAPAAEEAAADEAPAEEAGADEAAAEESADEASTEG